MAPPPRTTPRSGGPTRQQQRHAATTHASLLAGLLVRTDHCTEPYTSADPGGPTHVHHDPVCSYQVVTSTDAVVGRTLFVDPGSTASVGVHSSTLRAERCRFEGGAELGLTVRGAERGAEREAERGSVELVSCSLGLTAQGSACDASGPGISAMLQGCRVEGRTHRTATR